MSLDECITIYKEIIESTGIDFILQEKYLTYRGKVNKSCTLYYKILLEDNLCVKDIVNNHMNYIKECDKLSSFYDYNFNVVITNIFNNQYTVNLFKNPKLDNITLTFMGKIIPIKIIDDNTVILYGSMICSKSILHDIFNFL